MNKYRIYGNIASSKNGKIKTKWGIIDSKATKECYKKILPQLKEIKDKFISDIIKYPIHLHIYFYRWTKHKFDYINAMQTVQDAFVKVGLLEDDNCDIIIPVFEGYEVVSKEEAGCKFWVE